MVFGGYALGWRHELAGGTLAILGTIAFFVINALTVHVLPGAAPCGLPCQACCT